MRPNRATSRQRRFMGPGQAAGHRTRDVLDAMLAVLAAHVPGGVQVVPRRRGRGRPVEGAGEAELHLGQRERLTADALELGEELVDAFDGAVRGDTAVELVERRLAEQQRGPGVGQQAGASPRVEVHQSAAGAGECGVVALEFAPQAPRHEQRVALGHLSEPCVRRRLVPHRHVEQAVAVVLPPGAHQSRSSERWW